MTTAERVAVRDEVWRWLAEQGFPRDVESLDAYGPVLSPYGRVQVMVSGGGRFDEVKLLVGDAHRGNRGKFYRTAKGIIKVLKPKVEEARGRVQRTNTGVTDRAREEFMTGWCAYRSGYVLTASEHGGFACQLKSVTLPDGAPVRVAGVRWVADKDMIAIGARVGGYEVVLPLPVVEVLFASGQVLSHTGGVLVATV